MLDTPLVTQTEAQLTAVIHVTATRDQMQEVMGPGIQELLATVARQGIEPAGPWFTHHFRIDDNGFDFEIGVPVASPVTPEGRVASGEWPATHVARAVHRGAYEGLPDSWAEFDAWLSAQGLDASSELWEQYVTGPESGDDPAAWRTELNRQLTA